MQKLSGRQNAAFRQRLGLLQNVGCNDGVHNEFPLSEKYILSDKSQANWLTRDSFFPRIALWAWQRIFAVQYMRSVDGSSHVP
jgi:hypothetical protein